MTRPPALALTRAQVLGYRAWAQGLDRRSGAADLVLGLGVQDTPHGSAAAALAARGEDPVEDGAARDRGTVTVWSWRGAPHRHHRSDLRFLAVALWPVDDADAQARIANPRIKDGARRGIEAFAQAATAMRTAVTERMLKGDVSTLVSEQVPADLTYDCPTCRARHISGGLFQQVGLAAGVQVETEGRNTYLSPLPAGIRPKAVPARASGTAEALARYVDVLAPATPGHLAAFLGTNRKSIEDVDPSGLVEVSGPSGAGWVPVAALDRLQAAKAPRLTRLLPPSDPWLQGRDREFLVPDEARRKAVWGAIGNPGVLLVDGEVEATWRAKIQRRRLVVTVTGFAALPAKVQCEIEPEATLLAAARGVDTAAVVVEG